MLIGRVFVALAIASLLGAGPAQAAGRPGTTELLIAAFEDDHVEGLATGPGRRILAASRNDPYPLDPAWLRAYLPDGRPDPTLGGTGIVQLADGREIADLLVQPDGRIVVAQTGDWRSEVSVIRRLNADGTPDASFGTGGSMEPQVGTHALARVFDMALQPDGRLLVSGGEPPTGGPRHFNVVQRYLPDGSPDGTFGTDGTTGMDMPAPGLALQPGGGVIVNSSGPPPAIARLSPGGSLDTAFGAGGINPVELGHPSWADHLALVHAGGSALVLPDGRIRVATPFSMPVRGGLENRMSLLGLTADGHAERGFGLLGLALSQRPERPGRDLGSTQIVDPQLGIVVAGERWVPDGYSGWVPGSTRLWRFRPDGSTDRSFGDGGISRGSSAQELAFLDDDTLLAADSYTDPKYGSTIRALHAGYDLDDPSISIRARGCRTGQGRDNRSVRARRRDRPGEQARDAPYQAQLLPCAR